LNWYDYCCVFSSFFRVRIRCWNFSKREELNWLLESFISHIFLSYFFSLSCTSFLHYCFFLFVHVSVLVSLHLRKTQYGVLTLVAVIVSLFGAMRATRNGARLRRRMFFKPSSDYWVKFLLKSIERRTNDTFFVVFSSYFFYVCLNMKCKVKAN
jgi:hypothetical protein